MDLNHNKYEYEKYSDVPQGRIVSDVISVKEWVLTLLVMSIPFVGLIMTIVWAFSSGTNISRRNYCIARLIMAAVVAVLIILFYLSIGFLFYGTLTDIFRFTL